MKVWWLLGFLALFLLVWGTRERFDTSPQCPPGFIRDTTSFSTTDLRCKKKVGEPTCPSGYTMTPFVKMAEGQFNGGICTKGGDSSVPQCAEDTTLNVMDDKQVCVEYAFVRSPASNTGTGTQSAGGGQGDIIEAKCPDKSLPEINIGLCMDIGKTVECPPGYKLYSMFTPGVGNKAMCVGTNVSMYTAIMPTHERDQRPPCRDPSHLIGSYINPEGNQFTIGPMCMIPSGTSSATGGSTNTTGGAGAGSGAGSGSGSGSGSGAGAGAGGGVIPASVRKQNVLGPVFTSYGAAPTDGTPESHKNKKYPQLLGGGAHDTKPEKSTMPTCEGLGCAESSIYFPYSRQPGDMDLIPDPYRVSQQFSASNYSFKTDPSPFLTDFSAFLS